MIFFTPCNSCILDNWSFPLTPNNFRSPSEHFLQVNTSKGGIGGTFPVDSELRFRRSKMTRILANSNQNWTLGLLSFIWWFFSPPVTRASFRTQASRLLKKIFGPLRNIFSAHVCLFLFFYFSIYIFGYLKVPRTTIGLRQVPLVFSLPIFINLSHRRSSQILIEASPSPTNKILVNTRRLPRIPDCFSPPIHDWYVPKCPINLLKKLKNVSARHELLRTQI